MHRNELKELQRCFFILRFVVLFLFCFLNVPDVFFRNVVAVLLHSFVTVLVVRMSVYILPYNRIWTTGNYVLSEWCYGIFLVSYY